VFFKLVRSKTKFWQMVGRGTRLCPDLFGPGKHKEFFYIFDYCQNLEFFKQNPDAVEGSTAESLGKRLFKTRLELISELDNKSFGLVKDGSDKEIELRRDVASLLHEEVAAMNVENFVVRAKRRVVEKYTQPGAWKDLKLESFAELAQEVAGLPSELEADAEEAKRFDLLMLNLQLAVLRVEPAFSRLSDQVKAIAGLLEEKSSIPMVHAQMPLIQEIQTDEWWQDVTTPMLEIVRRRLRALIKLIEKAQRKPIYTDFEDELGQETKIDLPGFTVGDTFEKFREKARAFLRQHQNEFAIYKLRMNAPLMPGDLADLERILAASGVGSAGEIERAKQESKGLGLFVRSLVGMDREAAKRAFAKFLSKKSFTANQIEFVDMIINHLTTYGAMDPDLLYESPFTDIAPQGPEGLFTPVEIDELVTTIHEFYETAV
jgi:type I restriction enzyme R subunit